MAKNTSLLTLAEQQSNYNRVNWAEGLIRQLPATHDGRNSWLLNYGVSDEAVALRVKHNLKWIEGLGAAETFGGPAAVYTGPLYGTKGQ